MEWAALVPELQVTDVPRSLAFYAGLGFSVRFAREDPSFAYLELGDAQLMVQADHPRMWQTGPYAFPRGRGMNLSIEVTDVGVIARHLEDAGVPLFREIADTWYDISTDIQSGQRELLVQDPDGYLIRLIQPLGERSRTDACDRSRPMGG